MAISNNSEDLEQTKKELAELKMENEALRKRIFKWENLSEEDIKTYTGLDASVFNTVVAMIERFQSLSYWSGKPVNSITSHNQLLIFLMRLRRDMPYFDLAKRYGVSHTTIQNIFFNISSCFPPNLFHWLHEKHTISGKKLWQYAKYVWRYIQLQNHFRLY